MYSIEPATHSTTRKTGARASFWGPSASLASALLLLLPLLLLLDSNDLGDEAKRVALYIFLSLYAALLADDNDDDECVFVWWRCAAFPILWGAGEWAHDRWRCGGETGPPHLVCAGGTAVQPIRKNSIKSGRVRRARRSEKRTRPTATSEEKVLFFWCRLFSKVCVGVCG